VPRPTLAYRSDLRPAFTKNVPTSLADLRSMEQHVKALAARVSPAVVAVQVGSGSGSGVIISADGLVLTAGHVCGAPDRDVQFTFPDGKTARGKTVGANHDNDTGLMRITDRGPWPHAEMGDLGQALVGDWVLALGHPGGFDLRRSLVVRLGRIIRLDSDALQTDCTISPGDSGGPLFDMHGRVIGIHSAISSSVAENYHVAVTEFYEGWKLLVKAPAANKQADRPQAYVGARGEDDPDGCRLTAVDEDGPAAKAGLKVGDLVVKVDGREVRLYASLLRWVAETEPGETLNLEVRRGDKHLSLEVRLEASPQQLP
jgi:serine protease Do